MHITLTPDPTLPDNTLHVTDDLDDDLLAVMRDSHFDIVIDDARHGSGIRLSPTLLDQIMEWMVLRRVSRRDV